MAVQGLFALQNGFIGFERSGLFFGERSGERVQIPVCCYLVRTGDALILFDTGFSPRAVPGLLRTDPLARFSDEDLLVHRLDALDLEPADVDMVVLSHLHYDHAGGAALFQDSELIVQQDEYAYAHYPVDLLRRASTTGRTSICRAIAGASSTATPSSLPASPRSGATATRPAISRSSSSCRRPGPVILAGDSCYWQESIDTETPPGVVWDPTRAMHSIKRLKTIARLTGGRIFPSHDPAFWAPPSSPPTRYR